MVESVCPFKTALHTYTHTPSVIPVEILTTIQVLQHLQTDMGSLMNGLLVKMGYY